MLIISAISKVIIVGGFLLRMRNNVKFDKKQVGDEKIGARLATATIFIVTCFLFYFAGLFNLFNIC